MTHGSNQGIFRISTKCYETSRNHRVKYFLERFCSNERPSLWKRVFWGVTHWYRFEFQNMGHLTSICCYMWLAPEHRERKVLATMPRNTQNDQDRELVMSLQIHSCIQRRCKRCAKGDHCKIANMVSHTK